MKPFSERLERIEVEEQVHIPTLDGQGIAQTIKVKVPALRDPKDGEIYFDNQATALLDKVKARHMGLLTPEQIRSLRERLGLTQREVSELLQIGEKTWTRWETGHERPSRSTNVLLSALSDGKIDVAYLLSLARRRNDWLARLASQSESAMNPWLKAIQGLWENWEPSASEEVAEAIWKHLAAFLATKEAQSQFAFKIEKSEVSFPMPPATHAIQVQPVRATAGTASPERTSETPSIQPAATEELALAA
jgi:DNA-binding transcriptional regulator YiaG